MKKVILYSALLIIGLIGSQTLPTYIGPNYDYLANIIRFSMMTGLSFIMIHVGLEFHVDKSNLKKYGWDYIVAFTAASFPWIFATLYFIFFLLPPEYWNNLDAWKETLLAGRFAAPTSAGVLFSMLIAAGLGSTWIFKKARILAIFDDLDTVILMIPLKMLMVGVAYQLGIIVCIMFLLLAVGFIWLHRVKLPITWGWVLVYSALIAGSSEAIYAWSSLIDPTIPMHIEVLLPAFVLGCIATPSDNTSIEESEAKIHKVLNQPRELIITTLISAIFMVLVGLSMPLMFTGKDTQHPAPSLESLHSSAPASTVDDTMLYKDSQTEKFRSTITASQPNLSWGMIILHVIMLTIICNIGKMFPAFCYRKEAHWKHRLAVSICMWPRGEVGAGVLVLSLSYGIGGPIVTVAMLSLALNISLTGLFIMIVKRYLLETQ